MASPSIASVSGGERQWVFEQACNKIASTQTTVWTEAFRTKLGSIGADSCPSFSEFLVEYNSAIIGFFTTEQVEQTAAEVRQGDTSFDGCLQTAIDLYAQIWLGTKDRSASSLPSSKKKCADIVLDFMKRLSVRLQLWLKRDMWAFWLAAVPQSITGGAVDHSQWKSFLRRKGPWQTNLQQSFDQWVLAIVQSMSGVMDTKKSIANLPIAKECVTNTNMPLPVPTPLPPATAVSQLDLLTPASLIPPADMPVTRAELIRHLAFFRKEMTEANALHHATSQQHLKLNQEMQQTVTRVRQETQALDEKLRQFETRFQASVAFDRQTARTHMDTVQQSLLRQEAKARKLQEKNQGILESQLKQSEATLAAQIQAGQERQWKMLESSMHLFERLLLPANQDEDGNDEAKEDAKEEDKSEHASTPPIALSLATIRATTNTRRLTSSPPSASKILCRTILTPSVIQEAESQQHQAQLSVPEIGNESEAQAEVEEEEWSSGDELDAQNQGENEDGKDEQQDHPRWTDSGLPVVESR